MTSRSRDIFAYLPPPAEALAMLIGAAELTVFGLAGFVNPGQWAKGFGVPDRVEPQSSPPKQPDTREEGIANNSTITKEEQTRKLLITAIAARNIQNGIMMLTLGLWAKDRRILGINVILGIVTTATDYFVVRWYGVKQAASGHLIGVGNCLLVGASLLFWSREDPWW